MLQTDLGMAGYTGDRVPPMQERMMGAARAIPGVESVGLASALPLADSAPGVQVFTDQTTNLSPANAVAEVENFHISAGYFHAAGTALVSGRAFTGQDDSNAPLVAVINPELARRLFGSVSGNANGAIGRLLQDRRTASGVEVVGIAERANTTA